VAGGGGRVGSLMEPLRGRSFRLYWVGQTTSASGDQVFLVPGVRDYRAPPHPGGGPAGVHMLAGDRNDAR
jgi:hypothetical protein